MQASAREKLVDAVDAIAGDNEGEYVGEIGVSMALGLEGLDEARIAQCSPPPPR
jgi:hypothetical protein